MTGPIDMTLRIVAIALVVAERLATGQRVGREGSG
jgi:hypothetical protein